jgi:CshA-type fibril repeat protein
MLLLSGSGATALNFPVPATAIPWNTFARFRCSTVTGTGPTGPGGDGEVEDYRIPINNPPTAVADSALTQVNTLVILPTIATNDTDTDGAVLSTSVDLDPGTPGQQNTFTVPGEGTFSDDGAGNITFTPDPAFAGTSTIAHTVSDNDGGISAPANLSVRVNALPVSNPDSAVTQINTPVLLATVTANDTDSDGTVVASSVDLDPGTPGQQNTFTVPGEGTFSDDGAGNITFTPDPAFTGTSTISHTVSDNDGGTSAPVA